MSLPGPPPAENGVTAAGTPIRIWSSAPDDEEYYQEILGELADRFSARQARWDAVLMLRLLRLRLHNVAMPAVDFLYLRTATWLAGGTPRKRALARKCLAVYSKGRLSEVGVQLGCPHIVAYPLHIDVDWYGSDPLPHWWDAMLTGLEAEMESARGNLHFLEESFGLAPSPIDPAGWSWPVGTTGDIWAEKLVKSVAPGIADGFARLVMEWHEGEAPGDFKCKSDGAKFWYATPRAQGPDNF